MILKFYSINLLSRILEGILLLFALLATSRCAQGLFLDQHLGIIPDMSLRDHMGYKVSNTSGLHTMQAPYPLHYPSGHLNYSLISDVCIVEILI